jgi:ribose transport system ATP-binding protein
MIVREWPVAGAAPLFRMEGVSKRYGGVRALEKADLDVTVGRIHAILGENGAGKSTLIKIMAGVVAPDEGRMVLDGREISFASPAAANRAGIVCIFQELSLIPDLPVADNIAISDPPERFGMIDRRQQRRIAEEALARAGAEDIHPLALVRTATVAPAMVEIAAALARSRAFSFSTSLPRRSPRGRLQGFGAQASPDGRAGASLHFASHARSPNCR